MLELEFPYYSIVSESTHAVKGKLVPTILGVQIKLNVVYSRERETDKKLQRILIYEKRHFYKTFSCFLVE